MKLFDRVVLLIGCACLLSALPMPIGVASGPDAITPDGGRYSGPLKDGKLHGRGTLEWESGARYEGEFRDGMLWGSGRLRMRNADVYEGAFERGDFHGKGRYENAAGDVYEGDFKRGEFSGTGTYLRKDGARHEGGFEKWRMQGAGKVTDSAGNVYEGQFSNGELNGKGRAIGKDGGSYEGEFQRWVYHGQGVLRLPNGDEYRGTFAHGLYDGEGTLKYASPRADGRTQDSGRWRYGRLDDEAARRQAAQNVETALYAQRRLLDQALASLAPREAGKINLYLLAIGGDGSQEVFRREVEFVRAQFDREFGTRQRSLALVNSRNSVASAPMATLTSIRESLKAIAERMNKDEDILFLFLTSHGSKAHEFMLDQDGMNLPGLTASHLGELLKETGIRWKVVLISACYAGGFIDHVKDDWTLVMTAARHDRASFGCADENDFTYFGRAFFKEALPASGSFQDAFAKAQALVHEWETENFKSADKAAGKAEKPEHSLPQIHDTAAIRKQLQRWWAQRVAQRH